ncbi:unnamed protein product [Allacma fusca]|uniref:Glycoprotein-N-acetylgalactosamine 3-beta-galactosyltransferase 1 n=1 Tax=Allacma fusca TaxID=39272 RepID=A0A8J2KS42_9HEXA|nr:unnamed protein product [Allacma fusca]
MVRRLEHRFFVVVCISFIFFLAFYWYSGMQTLVTVKTIETGLVDTKFGDFGPSESQILGQKVRILCLVLTGPKNIIKVRSVKDTWGRRCNKLLFVSSEVGNDTSLGIVALQNVSEGRNFLWAKTKQSFRYVWDNHMNDADWFMKADDDTYVVLDNLRHFLKDYDTHQPIYFGCKFNPDKTKLYASGGAGYVLSKESVRRFIEEALPNKKNCSAVPGGSEDLEMGKCLRNVGVELGDSRDKLGKHRFMALAPDRLVARYPSYPIPAWYKKYMAYPQGESLECCSQSAISFHYVTPPNMYVLEFLIYHLYPIGVGNDPGKSFIRPELTAISQATTTTTTITSKPLNSTKIVMISPVINTTKLVA